MPAPPLSPAAKSPLRVGLIGCGHIARTVHLPILLRLPQAALIAVAEPEPERREEAARRGPGITGVADYHDLLRMPGIDAVLICLPTALHGEAAEAALAAGKHVYLEKPVAADLPGARRVLDAWKQAGTVGMIGFNYRFNPLYQEARNCLESGMLGKITAVRSVFATAPHLLPEWKRARQTGGGALLDLASHHADLLRFFFGQEVEEVSCLSRSLASEDDTAVLEMRLAGGLLAQSLVSFNAAEEDRFEIYGEHGKLTVDRLRSVGIEISGLRQAEATPGRRVAAAWTALKRSRYHLEKRLSIGYEPSYQRALACFADAALSRIGGADGGVSPDLEDGYRSLAIIAAAQESARTGRTMTLGDVLHENPSHQ